MSDIRITDAVTAAAVHAARHFVARVEIGKSEPVFVFEGNAALYLHRLETWERDAQADHERVEQLRERWGSWQGALDEDPVLARQLLKKVLGTPIYVRPTGRRDWVYVGIGRYDLLLSGGVAPGEVVAVHKQHRTRADVLTAFLRGLGVSTAVPIAGGSDATLDECKTPSVNSGPPMIISRGAASRAAA